MKIEFRALDALKLVDKSRIHVQVPAAKQWSRTHFHKYSTLHPFDWTFSTTYDGTMIGMLSFVSVLVRCLCHLNVNLRKLEITSTVTAMWLVLK